MKIPKWDDIRVKLDKNEKINPLEQFVYNYDNADNDGSVEFISDLEKLIVFVSKEIKDEVIEEFEEEEIVCPKCGGEFVFDGLADMWNCCKCGHSESNKGQY